MNIESFREYCLKKKGASESYPFDKDTLVLKVMNKMFALCPLEKLPLSVNLKCDPERAVELREKYEAVSPGYHMNKKYWITVILDNSVPDRELRQWIDFSYDLVVRGLKKEDRLKLDAMK
ncbi:MAG: MmcQ/YjbR family DNA-binding protein [Ignavibacteria bacterium]|jgi:predicted DNA-binding protein (MmcQ/YjbR family)|nr:MmcQ/YjbR family DNA-binding protein [Ignavibacteria bacterium]MCU7504491.1 MmcQ/YjbR family DNA-binding protein [Ignavibacteria bacterium]MCU7517930.1 MmcQ/YjbR family DNA-binding protein [Ignavibacteria bacterium]